MSMSKIMCCLFTFTTKNINKFIYLIKNGYTALICASQNGYKEIVEILLKTQNINVNDETKVTYWLFCEHYNSKNKK